MKIIQIVPRLPPAIDGIGDYAINLATQLRDQFEIETHFIVGDPQWQNEKEVDGFEITKVSRNSASALLSVLEDKAQATTILLHYVGYGYARRGCPVWLVKGLQAWKNRQFSRRLLTMFHEINATGPPWTSAFWLSWQQTYLSTSLAKMSESVLTSKEQYASFLEELSGEKHKKIPHFPVFSGPGEPQQVLPLKERKKRLVVFGGKANRLRVYETTWQELSFTCKQFGIEEVWDIGQETGLSLSAVDGIPIFEKGRLSKIQISQILSDSIIGFLDYNPEYLAKSSIFAAYCAHGVCPVNVKEFSLPIDDIEARKHYWVANQEVTNTMQIQAIADNAYAWYSSHNLARQTETFAAVISGNLSSKVKK